MIDLCFMLAEFEAQHREKAWYRELATKMIESAKGVMDARFVQLSDPDTERHPDASLVVRDDAKPEYLMLARAKLFRDYALYASGDMILTDCDVTWKRDPAKLFAEHDFDIGLTWRALMHSMPYCGGMIFVRHGSAAALEFLNEWWMLIATLPKGFHRWWGDQIALAILLGKGKPNTTVDLNGCKVRIFDSGDTMFNVGDRAQIPPERALCVHYKGKAKAQMIARGEL